MKNLIVKWAVLGLVYATSGHAAEPQRTLEPLLMAGLGDRLSAHVSVPPVGAQTQGDMRGAMERPLGTLTAVERTYVLDISDCQAHYKVRGQIGQCRVQKFPRDGSETLGQADSIEQTLHIPSDWAAYPNYYITLLAEVDGYSITVTQWWQKFRSPFGSRNLQFGRVKRYIQQAIDKIPHHELKATVYLVQTDSR